jgi:hypothetical protein
MERGALVPRPDARERALYHQVHPAKLATDISTAVASLGLLAQHRLALAMAVMFGPSILVSALLVGFGDFLKRRDSRLGDYLRRYMTTTMQAVRLLGMGIAAMGSWLHARWLLPIGAAIIGWGWIGRWILDRPHRASRQ